MDDLDAKITVLTAKLAAVGDFLLGSIRRTRAKYVKKDGTVSYHKAQPIFTYTDPRSGKQKKVRIREECFERVRLLAENGKNHRRAERALCELMLQRNLPEDVKKNCSSRSR